MPTRPLIGIIGRKRSGKDTFASRLTADHGFTRVAFADPLRDMAYALNPIVGSHRGEPIRLADVVDVDGWEEAKTDREVRRTLQRLGTEAGRAVIGDTVWIDAAIRRIESIDGPVVITDCRFPNEADYVRRVGGSLVRVARPGLTADDAHPSETALDDYAVDFYVANNGTIAEFHTKADAIVRTINAEHAVNHSL